MVNLNQRSGNRLFLDYSADYYLILKKGKTMRKLIKFARTTDEKRNLKVSNGFDTIILHRYNMDNVKLEHYISRQFIWKQAGAMEKNSRTPIMKLRKRTFHLRCKGTKSGSGGREYIDPATNSVVFRRRFWIS